MRLKPIIVILGPTAVGKTAISIQLAQRFNGEIISADSRLFYRGMDIGTAKPTEEEMQGIPHHLIDVAAPDEVWSLGKFKHEAQQIIEDIQARGKLPFVVGGTGQYVRALTRGWMIPEIPPNEMLRIALEQWADEIGGEGLHKRLAVIDHAAAENIDYRNLRRTIRALEVVFSTGVRFSEQRIMVDLPYRGLQLGLNRPRPELYERIDIRIEQMLAAGFLDEVQRLLDKGYSRETRSFSAIGYREAAAHLNGEISLDEMIVLMKRYTRIYVRRQTNWFKPADPEIHWHSIHDDVLTALEEDISAFI